MEVDCNGSQKGVNMTELQPKDDDAAGGLLPQSKAISNSDLSSSMHSNSVDAMNKKQHENQKQKQKQKQKTKKQKQSRIPPICWMVLFAECMDGLVEGVAIGAAFSKSLSTGLGLTLAAITEEVPQHLGQYAILVHAGMGIWKAALANLLAACVKFVGFAVGSVLGEIASVNQWIFCFATGMYLFISLSELVPEMAFDSIVPKSKSREDLQQANSKAPVEKSRNQNAKGGTARKFKWAQFSQDVLLFGIQNLGILTGFGSLLMIVQYADSIQELFHYID